MDGCHGVSAKARSLSGQKGAHGMRTPNEPLCPAAHLIPSPGLHDGPCKVSRAACVWDGAWPGKRKKIILFLE